MWLTILTYLMFRREERAREEEQEKRAEARRTTYIEDVFLLDKSGRLVEHLTRRLKPYADGDILSGMLRGVQEFVRDAFLHGEGEERGELSEVSFGELKISICSGQHVILATVVRGKKPADILEEMKAAVHEMEEKHGLALRDWKGEVGAVRFVDTYLEKLLEGGYRKGHRKPQLVAAD